MSAANPRPTLVLDTNLVVSGVISAASLPRRVLDARRRAAFNLISSTALLGELIDVLNRAHIRARHSLGAADVDQIITALDPMLVEPLAIDALPLHCRDPKDDQVLATALGGNADYIVTGDQDLLVLDGHPALGAMRIVTPRAFLDLLGQPEVR